MHPLDKFRHCPVCGSDTFTDNDFKSRRCGDCGFVYYLNPSAATVAVITDGNGKILVATRSKEPAKGTLDLPGGFCDCNETAEEGVRREVLEETGLIVTEARYLFSLPNRYLYSGLNIPTLDLFFLCKAKDTTGATARECALALRKAGAAKVYFAGYAVSNNGTEDAELCAVIVYA